MTDKPLRSWYSLKRISDMPIFKTSVWGHGKFTYEMYMEGELFGKSKTTIIDETEPPLPSPPMSEEK